ncbi:heme-binding protein [Chryseolinea sp. T2]|uniref:GlcG/HbpS family heme-binding protein n=1 Tax=Chryseolinea sp. T2 TaxID=3129255 RepID=UPI0030777AF5
MFSQLKVSSIEAMSMIDDVLKHVARLKKDVAVAIAGPEGELIAFIRMDGASPAASRIAINKAYTAAIDRKDTRLMGEFMTDKNRPQTYWGDDKITGFGGGVTIRQEGTVVGGIGVSGLSEEDDEAIANAAIKAVFGK